MKKLDIVTAFSELCKASGKYGLYVSFSNSGLSGDRAGSGWDEIRKAAPYLDTFEENDQILMDGQGIILCDSQEEMADLYHQTVGDEGPTRLNSYAGPAKVYALSCDSSGLFLMENT